MQADQHNSETNGQPPAASQRTRFHIEKLEERIAPSHKAGHQPPGHGGYYDSGPPGHQCGHPKGPCRF